MADLNHLLNERKQWLEKLLKRIEKDLADMPEGRLRINKRRNSPRGAQYYQCIPGGPKNGIYLPISENDLAKKLAQKAYLLQLREQLKKQLTFFKTSIPDLSDRPFLKVYDSLTANRKELVMPLFEDDDTFVAHWLSSEYERMPFEPGTPIHITDRGERVRSKSEKILADRFYALGIPYLYEKPVRLSRNKKRVPDFTLLNIRRRETFYWEHFGMMDDKDYVNSNISKINEYARAGIIPGKNLIMTFETKEQVLDINTVNQLIKAYLL